MCLFSSSCPFPSFTTFSSLFHKFVLHCKNLHIKSYYLNDKNTSYHTFLHCGFCPLAKPILTRSDTFSATTDVPPSRHPYHLLSLHSLQTLHLSCATLYRIPVTFFSSSLPADYKVYPRLTLHDFVTGGNGSVSLSVPDLWLYSSTLT